MRTVSHWANFLEMSKSIFLENSKNYFKMSSAVTFPSMLSIKCHKHSEHKVPARCAFSHSFFFKAEALEELCSSLLFCIGPFIEGMQNL